LKWLAVLILVVGCNKSTTSTSENPAQSCNEYKEKVLEAAVTEKETKDDIVYAFKSNEQEAIKFLKEYSTKHYASQPRIESLKAVAEACTQDKIKKWQDSILDEPCYYIFSEFKYFNGLINTLKTEKWSADTKALALAKAMEMIRFYFNKNSLLTEISISHTTLKSLVENKLVNQKLKPELDLIEIKLNNGLAEIQALRKASLTKEPNCSDNIYLKEYRLSQEVGKELSELVKKI